MHRQRILVVSLLGLLKGRQSSFVDYYSQLVIGESDAMDKTSEDDLLDSLGKKNLDFFDKMQASGNEVDQRLLAIFNIREKERAPGIQEARLVGPTTTGTLLLEDISGPSL